MEITTDSSIQLIGDCSRLHINSCDKEENLFAHSRENVYKRLMEVESKFSEFEGIMGSLTHSLVSSDFNDELSQIGEKSQFFLASEHSLIKNLRDSIESLVQTCLVTSFTKKDCPQIEEDQLKRALLQAADIITSYVPPKEYAERQLEKLLADLITPEFRIEEFTDLDGNSVSYKNQYLQGQRHGQTTMIELNEVDQAVRITGTSVRGQLQGRVVVETDNNNRDEGFMEGGQAVGLWLHTGYDGSIAYEQWQGKRNGMAMRVNLDRSMMSWKCFVDGEEGQVSIYLPS